jgi:hypothetical protein
LKKPVQSVVLRVISLAQFTITSARAEAIDNKKANPFEVQIERLQHEIACLPEEVRIKDQRMVESTLSADESRLIAAVFATSSALFSAAKPR